jgi:protein ImuA
MMKLEHLRKEISKIEHRHAAFRPVTDRIDSPWCFGCAAIDQALPNGQLLRGGLHDFSVPRVRDTPAMGRFAMALLQRLLIADGADKRPGEIIWCQTGKNMREYGRPYGPGLKALGLAPERLVIVSLHKENDLAFAIEESLRSKAVAAVIGEGASVGFTASRRLSLVCQEMATPCLFLNVSGRIEASAAATRWRITPAIGPPDASDPNGPGPAAWSVILARARGGCAHPCNQPWKIMWNDETHSFNLVSPAGNGTLANRPQKGQTLHTATGKSRFTKKVS